MELSRRGAGIAYSAKGVTRVTIGFSDLFAGPEAHQGYRQFLRITSNGNADPVNFPVIRLLNYAL